MQSTKTQPKNPADVEAKPNAGTTGEHADCCDALGKAHPQNQSKFVASEEHDVKAVRLKQLGSNGYQGN